MGDRQDIKNKKKKTHWSYSRDILQEYTFVLEGSFNKTVIVMDLIGFGFLDCGKTIGTMIVNDS